MPKKAPGAALVVEIGGPPKGKSKGKAMGGHSELDDETYGLIGEALQESLAAASSGDTQEAGRLFCQALDLKGGY